MNSSFRGTQFSSPGRWIWSRASMSWNREFRQQDIAYRRRHLSAGQVQSGDPIPEQKEKLLPWERTGT